MRSLIEEYILAAAPQKTMIAAVAGAKADAHARRRRAPQGRELRQPHRTGTRAADTRPSPNLTQAPGKGRGLAGNLLGRICFI